MTDIVAISADGMEHHFPEGTPQEAIDKAMRIYAGDPRKEDRSKWGASEKFNNIVNQLGTGAYKGIAGTVGLPKMLADNQGPPTNAISAALALSKDFLPSYQDTMGFMENQLGIPMAVADTSGEKLMQAGGAGATGVMFPGGPVANFVGGVSGSLASEVGGQLTEGTPLEKWARIIPGLIGGYAGSKLTNMGVASNAEQLLNRATSTVKPEQWSAAMRLQAQAAARGTPITSAEALAQVQGGNAALMGVQRNIENMQNTAPTMSQFMAQRPAANQAAAGSALDDIAPRSASPFETGPRVQAAAKQTVKDVRGVINAATEPAYKAASAALIPDEQFAAISADPAFQKYLAQVRADDLLGPPIKDLPDNSVGVVNAVKKEMGETAKNYAKPTAPNTSNERAMRLEGVQKPMVAAAREASPEYDIALDIQESARRSQLDPLKRAPTGQLAKTDDWERQAKIILNETPGSEKDVAQAVKNIMARDPEAMTGLLRMKLEDTYNSALSNVKGNNEQLRAANFVGKLGANPQAMKSLEATIRALPNGDTQWAGFRRLLDVFEAQGQRLPANSPTSFNQQFNSGLQQNLGKGVKSLGIDMWANWNVERRSAELARVLTAPEGVQLLRQLAVLGPQSARAQQLVQAFYQGAQANPDRLLEKTR